MHDLPPDQMDFSTKFNDLTARVERALDALVPALPPGSPAGPARIHEAMRYSLQAGGKRLRPVLALSAAGLGGPARVEDALPVAVALECVHTYSLIHDDLPCMDDDDLRRGRPTCHRAFDEATALLAGDALLTQAFVILGQSYGARPVLAAALLRELADASSGRRLVGGQMQDLLAEGGGTGSPATAAELEFIHLNKTAAMLEASLVCGGLAGGLAPDAIETLRRAGRHLGLAFQIIDDVLDATVDTAVLGKTAGKDARAGKTTYVSLHGLDEARLLAARETTLATDALRALPGDSTFLLELAARMLDRRH
ncbi:MAG: polyprenyl synthetase family protein [Opitutaceae bacterium]|nr:polyprenyl synthetase family protein [Opitutaceae bacterium]